MSQMDTYEQRFYEGLGSYRFQGRFPSGYPKNLQAFDLKEGWFDCLSYNIGIKIQKEKKECCHHWSRYTIDQFNCKDCGLVKPANKCYETN